MSNATVRLTLTLDVPTDDKGNPLPVSILCGDQQVQPVRTIADVLSQADTSPKMELITTHNPGQVIAPDGAKFFDVIRSRTWFSGKPPCNPDGPVW